MLEEVVLAAVPAQLQLWPQAVPRPHRLGLVNRGEHPVEVPVEIECPLVEIARGQRDQGGPFYRSGLHGSSTTVAEVCERDSSEASQCSVWRAPTHEGGGGNSQWKLIGIGRL